MSFTTHGYYHDKLQRFKVAYTYTPHCYNQLELYGVALHIYMHSYCCCLGHLKTISCDFSVNNCDWVTDFRVQNSQASSPLLDYNTNSSNTGNNKHTTIISFTVSSHRWVCFYQRRSNYRWDQNFSDTGKHKHICYK